jgi:hypothetical protein
MKIITILMALAVLTGCASAEQRMTNRSNYRDSQVEIVRAQKQAEVQAAQQMSAEKVAMWQALSEAVKANPDAASHMAIVAAVASTGGAGGTSGARSNMVTLNRENETTAVDVLKVVTPGVVGALTQTGLAAIAAETLRNASDNNREVNLERIETDGKMWDVFGAAVTGAEYAPADATDNATTPDTTTPSETAPEDAVDAAEDVVDPSEDVDDIEAAPAIDCSAPAFSPVSPEYTEQCGS